jgi:hypothetical protein
MSSSQNDGEDDGVQRYSVADFEAERLLEGAVVQPAYAKIVDLLSAYACFSNDPPPHHHEPSHHHGRRGGVGHGGRHGHGGRDHAPIGGGVGVNCGRGGANCGRGGSGVNSGRGGGGVNSGRGGGGVNSGGGWKHANAFVASAAPPSSRPSIGCAGRSSGMRAVFGALNKANDKNYAKVNDVVQAAVRDGTASCEDVCDAILAKSYQDDGFAAVYGRLVADLLIDNAQCVQARVDAFVADFWASTDCAWLDDGLTMNPAEAYDAFCAAVKVRRHLVGRHRVSAMFVREGLCSEVDAEGHADRLYGMLRTACDMRSDARVDLALDFLAEFGKAVPSVAARRAAADLAAVTRDLAAFGSPKCKFKLMDLMATKRARSHHHPAQPAGKPAQPAGKPAPQAGKPAPQAGKPAPQAGKPAPQAGKPAPQAGKQASPPSKPAVAVMHARW